MIPAESGMTSVTDVARGDKWFWNWKVCVARWLRTASRDAEVRDLRKQLAELQRKTSAKSPPWLLRRRTLTPHRPLTASTLSARPRSAEMAKMLADLESKMVPSHPASILLRTQLEEAKKERDGAKPLLEKIQAAEKRLKTRQKAVEAATAKGDQLQQSLQATQEKLHEALAVRRAQECGAHGPTRTGGS